MNDLAYYQPVKQHFDRSKVLLHSLGCSLSCELLDVGRDDHRLDVREALPALVAPSEELPDGLRVGQSRIRVPDVDRKVLQEASAGPQALAGEEGREVRQVTC